ncbi:MAG TPA: sialidase family protein [Steroidobacteraceae bacterium]
MHGRAAGRVLASVAGSAVLLACRLSGAAPAGVLFAPDSAQRPVEEAGYPRIIRLEHAGAANGTLLATFAHAGGRGGRGELPIFRSRDGGASFESQPVGVISDSVHGWDIEAPALFELPVAQGGLPAGTLFAAGTAWRRGNFREQAMEIFVSSDGGASWSYRSACASESLQVNNQGHGIWEPYFAITADGSLNCFFSDERPSADGFAQVIAHVRSTDGGATWGPEIVDVGVRDGVQRPGMPTVVRLPNGTFMMSLEDCKAGQDSDQVCTDFVKSSPDGQDWTPISSMGTVIATKEGYHLLHTPTLTWSPYGGAQGTLIASGQRVVEGEEGHLTVKPESGRVLFANNAQGAGPWHEIPSPVIVDPTGGYNAGETACPGYSSPILSSPAATDASFIFVAATDNGNGSCRILFGRGSLSKSR